MRNPQQSHPLPAPETQSAARYVSAEKLALLFDPPLSITFVRRLQARRAVPFIRLGRRVLFDVDAVVKALADSAKENAA